MKIYKLHPCGFWRRVTRFLLVENLLVDWLSASIKLVYTNTRNIIVQAFKVHSETEILLANMFILLVGWQLTRQIYRTKVLVTHCRYSVFILAGNRERISDISVQRRLKIDTFLGKNICKFLFGQISCLRLIASYFQLCTKQTGKARFLYFSMDSCKLTKGYFCRILTVCHFHEEHWSRIHRLFEFRSIFSFSHGKSTFAVEVCVPLVSLLSREKEQLLIVLKSLYS